MKTLLYKECKEMKLIIQSSINHINSGYYRDAKNDLYFLAGKIDTLLNVLEENSTAKADAKVL